LILALKDDDDSVRYYAAFALGEINDIRAVEPLIQILRDNDSDVRNAAKEALTKQDGNKATHKARRRLLVEH